MRGSYFDVPGSGSELRIPIGYISGLQLVWNSPGTNGNNITVTPGEAWIPGLNTLYRVSSTITGPAMGFAASMFYYIYLYDNGGVPAIDILPDAPSSPYMGTARTLPGNNTRRYLATVKTNAEATPRMWGFQHFPEVGDMFYKGEDMSWSIAPWSFANNVSFAVGTVIRVGNSNATLASRFVPPTSKLLWMWLLNASGADNTYLQTSEDILADAGSGVGERTNGAGWRLVPVSLNASQEFLIHSGPCYMFLKGYREGR